MRLYCDAAEIDAIYDAVTDAERTELKEVHKASEELAPGTTPSFDSFGACYGDIGYLREMSKGNFGLGTASETIEIFKKAHILSFLITYWDFDRTTQLRKIPMTEKGRKIEVITENLLERTYWATAKHPGGGYPGGYMSSYNVLMVAYRPESKELKLSIGSRLKDGLKEQEEDFNQSVIEGAMDYLNSFRTTRVLPLYTHELDHFLIDRNYENSKINSKIDEVFGWAIYYYVSVEEGRRENIPTSHDEVKDRISSYAETEEEAVRLHAMIALIEHRMNQRRIKSRYDPVDWIRRKEGECINEGIDDMKGFIQVMFPEVEVLRNLDDKIEPEIKNEYEEVKSILRQARNRGTLKGHEISVEAIKNHLNTLTEILENPEMLILTKASDKILKEDEKLDIDLEEILNEVIGQEVEELGTVRSDFEDLANILAKRGNKQEAEKIGKLSKKIHVMQKNLANF
jgi:hypothetical protein